MAKRFVCSSLHFQQGVLAIWAASALTCMAAVVLEEQISTCNTPCDMLQLTCPASHRMAIREALFSVTPRPDDGRPCAVTHTCSGESVCCEQTSSQTCVFSYLPSHLEAVHRNCSGTRACFVKTERTREESISCPFFRPEKTVSHTILDYVCINDSATIDICKETETVIRGRTLFTMLDSRRWRNPLGGAVCRCTAESVQWPTTNTIAVFVVDLRLNVLRQAKCSKANLKLKSGSTTRELDCVSSRDPREAFPFIALLNHSNVATVELLLHREVPEFVWIGFEANEVEDIRLSCGLQGYVRIVHDDHDPDSKNGTGSLTDRSRVHMPVAAISGGVVGGLLMCALVVAIVVFIFVHRRRRTKTKMPDDYSEPQDSVDDMDVYYSTPEVNAQNGRDKGSKQIKADGPLPKTTTTAKSDEADDGEVYITAEIVRERKRQSGKKKVRILSIPEISDDVAEYYASPWDIRDRRRLDELGGDDVFRPDLFPPPPASFASPPKSPQPTNNTTTNNTNSSSDGDGGGGMAEDYAQLDRRSRRKRHEEESYDHVLVRREKAGKDDARNEGGKEMDCVSVDFVRNARPEPDGCNQNAAFSED